MSEKTRQLQTRINTFVEELATSTDQSRSSPKLLEYLAFTASFHHYSLHNTMLIFTQYPEATRVAGYKKWRAMGRQVKKGEKGIAIFAPMRFKRPQEAAEEDLKPILAFRVVYVFDVVQTEGEELPELSCLSNGACSEDFIQSLMEFAAEKNIEVHDASNLDGAYGRSMGGRIELSQELIGADRFSILTHEIAHELLDHKNRREVNRKDREIEAETVAHVVCRHFSIPSTAPEYLALYGADGKEVRQRLEIIVSAIQQIISGIESHQNIPTSQAING
jgi:antirestriction protein ArdC